LKRNVLRLADKVALVTGAGGGIGREVVSLFAMEGAKVVLAGRNDAALRAAATCAGKDAVCLSADAADVADNERLVRVAQERFGGLDVLVAGAAIEGPVAPLVDYPVESFDEVLAVNVRGVFLALKHVIPVMKKRGGGSIVILSSVGGIKPLGQGLTGYIASKHAVIGLMRTAALECAPFGIRVNCVLPGPTETKMMRRLEEGRSPGAPERAREKTRGNLPFNRYGAPEEVARLILFLASDEASICTGGLYMADGAASIV
jgi:NAD(P)-dependent dehydrogenase (short-subunit alcohol dehydrogenase family)